MSTSKKPHPAEATPEAAVTPPVTAPPGGAPVVAAIYQASGLIQQALALIIAFLRGPLTPAQSRAILRAKHAGKPVIVSLLKAAVAKPTLAPNGLTSTELQDQLDLSDAFGDLVTLLTGFTDRVVDTSRLVQAETYKVGLSVYAIAEQNTADPTAQNLVGQMKTAMANGPRNPKRQVITLAKPITVTYTDPAAAAAAQAAAEAVTGTPATGGNGKKHAPAAPSNSTGSTGTSTPATPTVPQVPVYTPAGPAGTAPATNAGTGSSSTQS